MKRQFFKYSFQVGVVLLNLMLAFYSTPVTDWGDTGEYMDLSRIFLGAPSNLNLAHRAPLYPIVLSGFMWLFDTPIMYKAVVYFQYILVALTTLMVFQIFNRIFSDKKLAILTALLFNISLSTIYYANIIYTEILTVFLFVLVVLLLFKIYEEGRFIHYFLFGTTAALLILTRYNTVPMIVTFFILLMIVLYLQKSPVKTAAFSMGTFILPFLLLINSWCFYNYSNHGFYGLFPHSGAGAPRNLTVASIRPDNIVSEENKPVLEIFLKAREEYSEANSIRRKGSLAKWDDYGILAGLYSGYPIYLRALPHLREYYNLPKDAGEYELSKRLSGFYQEIASQNRGFLLKFRFISFLSGFRASASVLPAKYGTINFNFLPGIVIKVYKAAFFLISICVFIAFFFFIRKVVVNRGRFDFYMLAIFFFVFSFWGINLVFGTGNDANRFKFPAEPFILGLFVFYLSKGINLVTDKFRILDFQEFKPQND